MTALASLAQAGGDVERNTVGDSYRSIHGPGGAAVSARTRAAPPPSLTGESLTAAIWSISKPGRRIGEHWSAFQSKFQAVAH
jgi:hypothetical protein